MWYYFESGNQVGPIEESALIQLIKENRLTSKTLVWQTGMPNWQALETTELGALLGQPAVAAIAPQASYATPVYWQAEKPREMQIKELKDLFMWSWICLIGTLVTFGLSAIATAILWYIILYKCWALIQDGNARTTPGKAVGFNFIPFFNFYWIFVAYPGWAKDANIYIRRYQLPIAPVSEGLATAMCVLSLLSIIPYLGFVTGVVVLILTIIMMNQFTNTAVNIIKSRP
jgi:hypothetical protein